MKVKLTDSHDRLAIKATFPDGELKYSTSRSGDRMTVKSEKVSTVALRPLFNQFNAFESPDETNIQRFQRAVKFLESFETLEAAVANSTLQANRGR